MTERRYEENEAREILAHAAEMEAEGSDIRARARGLTLAELQDAGREAGLSPEQVARAASAFDAEPDTLRRGTWMRMPAFVGRIVPLRRELTDREWEFLVSELRTTFGQRGSAWSRPDGREWSAGDIEAVLEGTPTGPRLRLGDRKRDAENWTGFGGILFGAGCLLVALGVWGGAGVYLVTPAGMALIGAGVVVANLVGQSRWANERERQMAHISEWTHKLLSPPSGAAGRRLAGGLILLIGVLAGAAAPPGAAAQGGLDVIVRNADTGAGLPRAQVTLPGLGYGGITDVEGHFHMPDLPSGPVAVEVRLLGYGIARREATVVNDSVVVIEVPLTQTAISVAGLVAVGSRSRPRTATESMVPIDALTPSELLDQGDTDIGDLLRTTIPSYNVNPQATGDAARIIRPANLRGLAPDHTLVLVNGKRRHRAAVITWIGNGVADGAQGPDLSSIPAIALRQVEVLRDGASAQYGSDAIAGVMNFHLKDARSGGALEMRGGGFGDGGGEGYTVSGNAGLPLGATGFANLSAEYGRSNSSSRSVQRADAALLVSRGNAHVRDPAQIWGAPKIEDDLKLWGNFGYFLGGATKAYAHANFASQRVTGGFFYRNPNTRSGVFSLDGGETLLIGDLLDARDGVLDGSAGCPVVRVTDGLPDPAALRQVLSDPNCFTFQERFPGGFTPQFGGDVTDVSLVAGVEGQIGRLHWDVSANYGENEVDFFIFNTVNASLGPATPVEFDPGLYRQVDVDLHVDAAYTVSDLLDLAAGVEWRDEHFTIGLGDDDSWTLGPLAPQGFSAGSNGFPGFSPIAAGDWRRANTAFYADAELRDYRDDRWTLGGALRFENFEDFGSTLNGKVAGRYALTDGLALRGSLSTGFRAPTPGQQNAFNVSTLFDRELGDLVNSGTIPSTSRVAALRGGVPLDAEKSRNLALGVVLERGGFLLTADYFRVALSDRIALTQRFNLTPDEQTRLLEEGIVSARNLQEFRFFTNDFSTRTQGLDVVAAYAPPALGGGTAISFALNRTQTRVVKFDPAKLDDTRIRQLEEGLPGTRWILTGKHALGRVGLLGRLSYYAGWFDARDDFSYPGEMLVDLEAAWSINESLTLTAGGQNALNRYPEENPGATFSGNRYGPGSPFGSNGGYYYARLAYRWQ